MMKNVNSIKTNRFDTYLNIYIGFSPLFYCFPIHDLGPGTTSRQVLRAHKPLRDTGMDPQIRAALYQSYPALLLSDQW
jgi:hypothetical protein